MKRNLTIPSFNLPDGSMPEAIVDIALLDASTWERTHATSPDGTGILDRIIIPVHEKPMVIAIWPNVELTPADTVYDVHVSNGAQTVSRFRTVVQSGGDLSWAEFVGGAV